MTRLGKASALIAVFAAGYAILMLINDQLTDFDISAGPVAVSCAGHEIDCTDGLSGSFLLGLFGRRQGALLLLAQPAYRQPGIDQLAGAHRVICRHVSKLTKGVVTQVRLRRSRPIAEGWL
jgi:hypothetical protein